MGSAKRTQGHPFKTFSLPQKLPQRNTAVTGRAPPAPSSLTPEPQGRLGLRLASTAPLAQAVTLGTARREGEALAGSGERACPSHRQAEQP